MRSIVGTGENSQAMWPVDAHVHLHRLADVSRTFDAALGNFRQAVPGRVGLAGGLLLTQMSRERIFELLGEMEQLGDWRLELVPGEPETLIARKGPQSLAVICGRQVRADDGLEIAALGTVCRFPDGRPLAECLREVLASGAVAAIPWGFGKWLGARGRRVCDMMERPEHAGVFLGDSGSRVNLLQEPGLIRRARARGLRVLAGTDPFPFAGDYRRVGSFGFLAAIEPKAVAQEPWHALRSWLETVPGSPPAYGRPSGPFRFLLNQFGMQFYNRLPRSVPS